MYIFLYGQPDYNMYCNMDIVLKNLRTTCFWDKALVVWPVTNAKDVCDFIENF